MNKALKKFWFVPLLITMTSCNKDMIGSYKYDKVHIVNRGQCYEIDSWSNAGSNGSSIQITFKDYGTMQFNTQDAILVRGKCIYCDK